MTLTAFRTVGRSGLIVSPLALGTMTFGASAKTSRDWRSPDDVSEAIFHAYVEAGGNFIDTADVYSKGRSEELIGAFVKAGTLRDKLVIATKFTFSAEAGNPNAGGNGRKNIQRALEGSLRRLQTDYIDLYWLHAADFVTPVEEVLQSLGDLVRAGKIRYFGFSNTPAWYATKAATLAAVHFIPGCIALQPEYSLIERGIEREHVPAASECGLGICVWGPLGSGFLTGKYTREGEGVSGQGRLETRKSFRKFTDSHWRALEGARKVAAEVGRTSAQVALAWVTAQPGITSLLLGANTIEQLRDNLASLEISLTPEQLQTLDESSALDSPYPGPTDLTRPIFGVAAVHSPRCSPQHL